MRKRLISAFLTLMMLLSLVPSMSTAAAAADSTGGPADPKCTITMTGVKAGELAQGVTYKTEFKNGITMLGEIHPPYMTELLYRTPWVVKETGRWMQKNEFGTYNDKFYSGMTYTLTINPSNIHYKDPSVQPENIKFVIDGSTATVDYSTVRKVKLQYDIGYAVDITIPGESAQHKVKVDTSIDHVYKKQADGTYTEVPITGDRTFQAAEGDVLKFVIEQDYVIDSDGAIKFFKDFESGSSEKSTEDKAFLTGNLKLVSKTITSTNKELVVRMGDRDVWVGGDFTNKDPVRLNAIYLDVLPAIENGRQVSVVTPTSPEKREAYTPGLSSADKLATYTITGHTAGESNPNDNGVYLYKKSTDPNGRVDGKYTLEFSVKLNGNFYCSDRTTAIYINGKRVPEKDIALTTGFGNSDSLPVYWNIYNRKIEEFGYTGWNMDIQLRDFASQYYENKDRYGLGLDAPMDFKKASDGYYRYTVSDGNTDKEVRAYGSFEAASGQSCTVTFPVSVPDGIRKWNANHSGEEKIGFTFRENATGGVFVAEDGGAYVPVEASYSVSDPDSEGNVTATATFTPENGKKYRVMGSVAATWNGKIVADTPMDNSFVYVNGVAKNYLTGSVVYTSAVRYGENVSIGRTGVLGTIPADKLHYQWQCSWDDGATWMDLMLGTEGSLPAYVVGAQVGTPIRVRVTADGYEGVIYSEPRIVTRATWTKTPVAPQLSYDKDAHEVTVTNTIHNNLKEQQYLISQTALSDTQLAAASGANGWIYSGEFDHVEPDKTYYVYTRMKVDDYHFPGTIYRYSTIYTGDTVPLTNLTLENNSGKIYVKKGEPLTINVVGTPANANQWNAIHFINQDNMSSAFTVTTDNGTTNSIPASTGTPFDSHKITITATGGGTLVASRTDTYNVATQIYTWEVVAYEDISEIIDRAEIIDSPSYADVTMSVGDSYTPENVNPTIQTNPDGVMNSYNLKWFVMTPAASATGIPTYSEENTYISVTADGKVTAKEANTAGENSTVALCAVDKTDGHFIKHISGYHVTITTATTPTLEKVIVGPTEKTMTVGGENAQLAAVKYPANAAGDILWSSDNTSVASVDADGKVTAVSEGTAVITASCGGKSATCTVHVVAAGHTHTYGDWTKLDDVFHGQTCNANDDVIAEPHAWTSDSSKTDIEATFTAGGTRYLKCSVCGAEKSEVTAKLEPVTEADVSVSVPESGAVPGSAVPSGLTYVVAGTDWNPAAGSAFASSTKYTVKVVLETVGANRFTNSTAFTINGKTATVVTRSAETVTLTYEFPATGTASSGGAGGGTAGGGTTGGGTGESGTTGGTGFTDVPSGAYYADAVKWAVEKGITGGTSATTFEPNGICTRAQAVTFLWRAAGSPEPKSASMPFTDVAKGTYYEKAVLWALENNITRGTTETTFEPNANCSRGQIVTFLWRSRKSPTATGTNPFADVKPGAYYADAVLWAVKENVTSGTSASTFSPDDNCTRAQIVTFIYRALAE